MYGKSVSQEVKNKISDSMLGEKNHFYGKHHTEETKQKLRSLNKGKIISDSVKAKISIKNKGQNNSFFGKKHSDGSILKMSLSKIGSNNVNSKAVVCLETQEKFESINIASKNTGICSHYIGKCCKGNRYTAGGFHWAYYIEGMILPTKEDLEERTRKEKEEIEKQKIEESGNNSRSKKVICIELNEIFNSIMNVERKYNIKHQHIAACCKGKIKTCGGYHWMYYEDYLKLQEAS